MLTIKSTKTQRYADSKPHLPQVILFEGITYSSKDVSIYVLNRALDLGNAEEVESQVEESFEEEVDGTDIEEIFTKSEETLTPKVKKRRRG